MGLGFSKLVCSRIFKTHRIFLNSTLVACSDLKSIALSETWPRRPHSIHWFTITFPIIYINAITGEIFRQSRLQPLQVLQEVLALQKAAVADCRSATLRSKCHGIGAARSPHIILGTRYSTMIIANLIIICRTRNSSSSFPGLV